MKKVISRGRGGFVLLALAFLLFSCTNPLLQTNLEVETAVEATGEARSLSNTAATYTLWAHRNIEAGTVSVWRDSSKLYIKFDTNDDYTLDETHVWVGTKIDSMRLKRHGYRGYSFARDYDDIPNDSRTWTAEVPFQAEWENKYLIIFAHAELIKANHHGRDEAWGGDKSLPYKYWWHLQHWYYNKSWMHFMYLVPPYESQVETYSVSGKVFNDVDTDGVQDSTEQGLSGVTLTLLQGSTVLSTKATGSDGSFTFTGLEAGTYTVTSGGLSGYSPTPYYSPISSKTVVLPPAATEVSFGLSNTAASKAIGGVAFYDANWNDTYDTGEPLLDGITVRIASKGLSALTDQNGAYEFPDLGTATSYTVSSAYQAGFVFSVNFEREVNMTDSLPDTANFGFAVDYNWIGGKVAEGKPVSYWADNLDKAIAGNSTEAQVDAATLDGYIESLSGFALAPLSLPSLSQASSVLNSTSTDLGTLLQKELLAAEFNYLAGAYIGGNARATYFFLYDGEYMISHPSDFDDEQRELQRQCYEAYNGSEGGTIDFPFAPIT